MTTAMTTSQLFRPQQQFNKGKYGRGKESCVPLYFFFFWVLLILVYELFKLVHTSQSVFRSKICMYVLLTLIGRVL